MSTLFRIHFAGEEPIKLPAEDAKDARKQAEKSRPGAFITKIKRVKGA